MCHRRTFLSTVFMAVGLALTGQAAIAAGKPKKDKPPKMDWYARVYHHAEMSMVGKFSTQEEALRAGLKWVRKTGKGAKFYGETVAELAK